jgi:hypothetical protein
VDFERPDPTDLAHLEPIAKGADYFADLGRVPRLVAAVGLAPFALYFLLAALVTPVAAATFAAKGEWPLAWGMVGIGAGHGAVGFGLGWLARRLWRGTPSANRRTVLPTWLVGAFLVGFLTPLALGSAVMFGVSAWAEANAGGAQAALVWGAGAVGWVAGLARAYVAFARLVRPPAGG